MVQNLYRNEATILKNWGWKTWKHRDCYEARVICYIIPNAPHRARITGGNTKCHVRNNIIRTRTYSTISLGHTQEICKSRQYGHFRKNSTPLSNGQVLLPQAEELVQRMPQRNEDGPDWSTYVSIRENHANRHQGQQGSDGGFNQHLPTDLHIIQRHRWYFLVHGLWQDYVNYRSDYPDGIPNNYHHRTLLGQDEFTRAKNGNGKDVEKLQEFLLQGVS